MEYILLLHPGQNKVYFDAAKPLFQEELALMLGNPREDITALSVAGRDALAFSAPTLSEEALQAVARSSGFFALFEQEGELLRPMWADAKRTFPESISGMQKYQGKTSEQFTRLLLNLSMSVEQTGERGRKTLFDPLCGRGTTLFEGLSLGLSVLGVEQNAASCKDCENFFLRYLKEGHFKHQAERSRPRGSDGRQRALFSVTTAGEKEDYLRGETQSFRLLHSDTENVEGLLKKNSLHLLVTDLPYGVQHGSHQGRERERSADSLLKRALPVWHGLLKEGAGGAISFNEYTTPWKNISALLQENGFAVLSEAESYRHRVGEAINRNLILFRKTGA